MDLRVHNIWLHIRMTAEAALQGQEMRCKGLCVLQEGVCYTV